MEEEKLEYINANERFKFPKVDKERKIDKLISTLVGKTIYINDPIVLKTIVGWKKKSNKDANSTVADNFLDDPAKVEELRKALK